MIKLKRLFFLIALILLASPPSFAQTIILDDVRQGIIDDNQDRLKSIHREIERRKKAEDKEKDERKKSYEERIKNAQLKLMLEKEEGLIIKSEELLQALSERSQFDSDKRWYYERLIKQAAEKPLDALPIEEQKEVANALFAQATAELIKTLKKKAVETAKAKRGEEYEEVKANQYLLVQLKQYTDLNNQLNSVKGAQQEKIEKKQESVVELSKELIEFLKDESIRRAEAKRELEEEEMASQRMQFKIFEGNASIHHGYDNNINADDASEGGLFIRNYASLSWLPSFSEFLKAELGTWYLADNYTDDQDVTFRIWAGQTNLKWFPRGNDSLEIMPAFEFSDTYYPNSSGLSTKENKLSLDIVHQFWDDWSQNLSYEELWTENNNNRPARNSTGASRTGSPLERHKRTVKYELDFPLPLEFNFNLNQRMSFQTSNDNFLDFYDYESYRILGGIGRSLTNRLYTKISYAYETKNYKDRTVSDIQVAQEDSTYTKKLSLFYFLKDGLLLNYTLTLTKENSNNPLFDYESMTHLVGAHFSF